MVCVHLALPYLNVPCVPSSPKTEHQGFGFPLPRMYSSSGRTGRPRRRQETLCLIVTCMKLTHMPFFFYFRLFHSGGRIRRSHSHVYPKRQTIPSPPLSLAARTLQNGTKQTGDPRNFRCCYSRGNYGIARGERCRRRPPCLPLAGRRGRW